jgi:hypothetical protein
MNSFLHFWLNLLSVFISALPHAGTPFSLGGQAALKGALLHSANANRWVACTMELLRADM